MNKILVTGANGQLGSEIKLQQQKLNNCQFIFTDIDELDLSNSDTVTRFITTEKPAFIVNCAAYTAVDKAESEPATASLINAQVPGTLAEAASQVNANFIHISTDFVFEGTGNIPLKETDTALPQSIYGKTKLAGEKAALAYSKGMVIRTSWLYSEHGHNFVKTILKYGAERDELKVVFDQVGTPTSAGDLAGAIIEIINQSIQQKAFHAGLYHYSNEGVCSWYDFAIAIKDAAHLPCKIHPIETSDYPLPAPRPAYSVMNKEKIKKTYSIDIPHWLKSLNNVISQLI